MVARACYNNGGIIDSVELLVAPAVRIESLYVVPDWKSGCVEAAIHVRNATDQSVTGSVMLSVALAVGGETLDLTTTPETFAAGDTLVKTRVQVADFRLWDIDNPVLYRVTVRVTHDASGSIDEKSTKCGFRDFRFADGYFRLNGKRIFLKSARFRRRFATDLCRATRAGATAQGLLEYESDGLQHGPLHRRIGKAVHDGSGRRAWLPGL